MESNGFNQKLKNCIIIVITFLTACTKILTGNLSQTSEATVAFKPNSTASTYAKCQIAQVAPTPDPTEISIFPVFQKSDHFRGSTQAYVTFIEYGDFQCPGCAGLAPILSALEKKYSENLLVIFRQLPLYDIHDKALLAAQASEAASDFGKFWEMHDLLFSTYENWRTKTPGEFSSYIIDQSSILGMDKSNFIEKFTSQAIIDRVNKQLNTALAIGLGSTPFLLINGQIYNGPRDFNSLDSIISLIILGKNQFSSCPDMTIDLQKQYIASITTEKGTITIQLFPDKAPVAVNAFVFLSRQGWYNNISFFRVTPGVVVQTGDPSATGLGGPGFIYQIETNNGLYFDRPGMVAMVNSGSDSNGSQFLITMKPLPELNGSYTIFGQVIEGFDVLNKLTQRDPDSQTNLVSGDMLIDISIQEK